MNVKRRGTKFEELITQVLGKMGAWAHFIEPKKSGAQPFDIIAVWKGISIAIDCKTCVANTFNINRLEDNQIKAFDRFLKAGGTWAYLIVWHNEYAYVVPYTVIMKEQSVKLQKSGHLVVAFEKKLNQVIREEMWDDFRSLL